MNRKLKIAGITLAATAAAGAAIALIIRDQETRHQRNLFSPNTLQRLAALGFLAREDSSVAYVTLLRDFIAWEPRSLLRSRAKAILARMEGEIEGAAVRVV